MRPLRELLDNELEIYAVHCHTAPYDGWLELNIMLAGHEDPNLTVGAPFLVSQLPLPQLSCSKCAWGHYPKTTIDEEQVVAMFNFIQVPKQTDCTPATVRVGKNIVTIPAGKAVQVWCRAPQNFDISAPLVLFEPVEDSIALRHPSIGEGLLEFNDTERPYVKIPISKYYVLLPRHTALRTF